MPSSAGARCRSQAESAADELSGRGIQASVLDLRWLAPLDDEAIAEAVSTGGGRVLVVHEANLTGGFGAEVAARIGERFFSLPQGSDQTPRDPGRPHTVRACVAGSADPRSERHRRGSARAGRNVRSPQPSDGPIHATRRWHAPSVKPPSVEAISRPASFPCVSRSRRCRQKPALPLTPNRYPWGSPSRPRRGTQTITGFRAKSGTIPLGRANTRANTVARPIVLAVSA